MADAGGSPEGRTKRVVNFLFNNPTLEAWAKENENGDAFDALLYNLVNGVGQAAEDAAFKIGQIVGAIPTEFVLAAHTDYDRLKRLHRWLRMHNITSNQKGNLEKSYAKKGVNFETLEGVLEVEFDDTVKIDVGRLKLRKDEIQDRIRKSGSPHLAVMREAEKLLRASLQNAKVDDLFKDLEKGKESYHVQRYLAVLEWLYEKLLNSDIVPAEMRGDGTVPENLRRPLLHPYLFYPRDQLLGKSRAAIRTLDKFEEAVESTDFKKSNIIDLGKIDATSSSAPEISLIFKRFIVDGSATPQLEALRYQLGFVGNRYDPKAAGTSFVTYFTMPGGFWDQMVRGGLYPPDAFDSLPDDRRDAIKEAFSQALYKLYLKLIDPDGKAREYYKSEAKGIYDDDMFESGIAPVVDVQKLLEQREKKKGKEKFPGSYILGDAREAMERIYSNVYETVEVSKDKFEEKIKTSDLKKLGIDAMDSRQFLRIWPDLDKDMTTVYKALFEGIPTDESPANSEDRAKAQDKFYEMSAEVRAAIMSVLNELFFSDPDYDTGGAKKQTNDLINKWLWHGNALDWMKPKGHQPSTDPQDDPDHIVQEMAQMLALKAKTPRGKGKLDTLSMRQIVPVVLGMDEHEQMLGPVKTLENEVNKARNYAEMTKSAIDRFDALLRADEFETAGKSPDELLEQYSTLARIYEDVTIGHSRAARSAQKIAKLQGMNGRRIGHTASSIQQAGIALVPTEKANQIAFDWDAVDKTLSEVENIMTDDKRYQNKALEDKVLELIEAHRAELITKDHLLSRHNGPEQISLGKNAVMAIHEYRGLLESLNISGDYSEAERSAMFGHLSNTSLFHSLLASGLAGKILELTRGIHFRLLNAADVNILMERLLPIAGPVNIPKDRIGKAKLLKYILDVLYGSLPPHPDPNVKDGSQNLTPWQRYYKKEILTP